MRLITNLCAIALLCILPQCMGWRFFLRGRQRGGNLGNPSNKTETSSLGSVEELWFNQTLDHFDPTNDAKWSQRYFVNKEHYKAGGPVFLMIGGEGEANKKWMEEGAWIHYAKNFNALCFQLEHRFYGKSRPTSDLSIKNLKYLSSEQALADLASFISAMKSAYNVTDAKWIAFGGSYPGSLAAWLRKKYPHLIHGSISSSGPLLAKIDFTEYFEVVTTSLATYSDNCVEAVQQAFAQIEILLKHMIGQRSLTEKFKLCDPLEKSIENALDISNLFETLADNFADVVQYNKDNRAENNVTIDTVCDILTNTTIGPQIDRLAAVNSVILKKHNESCLDFKYDKMIKEMVNISWDSEMSEGGRQWVYQTCTEFGFYQTSENDKSIFGNRFNADFFIRQCADVYSPIFTKKVLETGVNRTNNDYGALDPETTNVLYVHGSIDPWHALGLTESKNPNTPTIFIKGTAHCANMYEPAPTDLPELVEARKKIELYIGTLLT